MLPFSLNYNHLTMESFILELNQLFLEQCILARSASQNALSWGRGATSDNETSGAEIGNFKTSDEGASDSKMAFLRGLDTVYLLNIEH